MGKTRLFDALSKVDEEHIESSLKRTENAEKAENSGHSENETPMRRPFFKRPVGVALSVAAAIVLTFAVIAAVIIGTIGSNNQNISGGGPSDKVLLVNTPSPGDLDISITDITDSSSLIGVEINCSQIHSSPSHDKNPMGERSFTFGSLTFDGSPVEGPFGYVIRRGYNTYDEYAYMDKKTGAFFDVDIAGSLGLYMHSDDGSWENIVLDYMDDERAITIAKEFAGSFRDITRYEVSAIKENSPKIKTVYFQKKVNGILTTDRFQVDVSYDAIVLGYSSYMTDKIPVEIRTDDINIEEIDIEVSNYLKDILESNNIAEINKAITMLSLLEDGKRIIIEQYDMRVGDDGHSECIELMIVID